MKTVDLLHQALRCTAALLLTGPLLAWAQPIYRIVGPDGRVTFSDQPPASGADKASALGPGGRSTSTEGASNLPFELREAMNRYPVTIYTGEGCGPCASARALLNTRGVPYTERTISTTADVEALKRQGLDPTVPVALIGSQRLKGYSESEWSQYLDAAGYPPQSRLPSGYRNPAPTPLAPTTDANSGPRNAPPATAPTPLAPPPGPTPSNPAGIVF